MAPRNTSASKIEQKTSRLYQDIHPHNDNAESIDNYLKTLAIDESYFKSKNMLDCGFGGTGWALELFARAGARKVSGIDLNPRWRELHSQRLAHFGVPLDLRTGSVLELPFESNSFDYVHCNGVLHHTVDWKKGISEATRVLKPGGKLFLMLYGRFAWMGRVIHGSYRFLGKIIPYAWSEAFVTRTGVFKNPEISLLDAMYAPIEEHLTAEEIRRELDSQGSQNIRFFESAKWAHHPFSHPLLFGQTINHNVWADKL